MEKIINQSQITELLSIKRNVFEVDMKISRLEDKKDSIDKKILFEDILDVKKQIKLLQNRLHKLELAKK